MREGAGGERSRVREVADGRDGERSGATERPEWLHNMYRCQKGPLQIIFQIWVKTLNFPKNGNSRA